MFLVSTLASRPILLNTHSMCKSEKITFEFVCVGSHFYSYLNTFFVNSDRNCKEASDRRPDKMISATSISTHSRRVPFVNRSVMEQ